MICQTCRDAGQRSTVVSLGGTCTLMYCQPFYDEDGKHHHHDYNTRTNGYRCSNGHEWTAHSIGSCWCGWPEAGPYARKPA